MLAPPARRTPSSIAFAGAFAAVLGTFAGCSSLPPPSYPPFADHAVTAQFVVPESGRLVLPSSRADLVVHELRATPAPAHESFDGGERCWHFAPGAHVAVHCRFRAYAQASGQVPQPGSVLPGAVSIVEQQVP
jgi:hypothetical protein